MPRHELACPFELVGRFVELVLVEVQHTQVIVGRAVIEIGGEGLSEQTFSSLRVTVHQVSRLLRQLLRLERVSVQLLRCFVRASYMPGASAQEKDEG